MDRYFKGKVPFQRDDVGHWKRVGRIGNFFAFFEKVYHRWSFGGIGDSRPWQEYPEPGSITIWVAQLWW